MVLLCTASAGSEADRSRAIRLYKEKRFAEAAVALERHVAGDPGDVASRLLLGLCYQQAGERERAEAALREVVRRRPKDARARYYLARVQYLREKLDEAEFNAREAIHLGEPAERAQNLIGLIRIEQNRYREAISAFDAALATNRKAAGVNLHRGIALYRLGRYEEARRSFDAELAIDPDSAEARSYRARALAARQPAPAADPPPIRFREIAAPAGLHFILLNSASAEKRLIETMPGGVAAFDYNNDGLVDIYFTNGAALPEMQKTSPEYWNRLFRNEGQMRFTDVTAEAGVAGAGYCFGAAAADYDGDGNTDLFVTCVKRNLLYRNLGNGRFQDATARSGIKSGGWPVGAGWFDYNNDRHPDLFVVNYLNWAPEASPFCGDRAAGLRVYCHPREFEGLPNTLYRNRGDGAFEDVTAGTGILAAVGKGMSISFADYDRDGFMDMFVANDTTANFLFHNLAGRRFEEVAMTAGVAFTDDGKAISGMGSDFRDIDNDGLPDISVTALARETFPLFRNRGGGRFEDVTWPSRIGLLSGKLSGWGNGMFDLNNDGNKDLFSSNAHVNDNVERYSQDVYRQPNSVFVNLGNGTFRDASAGFDIARAHRGAAFADFDRDGRIDVVVTCLGEPAELWQNVSPVESHWLTIAGLPLGSQVRAGSQTNHVTTSVGYGSSSPAEVHFGLGTAKHVDLEIVRPGGAVQKISGVKTNQVLNLGR